MARRLVPFTLLFSAVVVVACGDNKTGGFPETPVGGAAGAGLGGGAGKGGSPNVGGKAGAAGKGGAGGKAGAAGKSGAAGKGGKGGAASTTCLDATKSEGCDALCAKWEEAECTGPCDREKLCAAKKGHCGESMDPYLQCEAQEGTFTPSASGCSIVHSCELDASLCTVEKCIDPGPPRPIGVPDAWFCDPDDYKDGDYCDCECGAPDPDCETAKSYDCKTGQVCSEGLCVDKTTPPGWTCTAAQYEDGSTCHCNCGAPDPDCKPGKKILGCEIGQTCDAGGACTGDVIDWKCSPAAYQDGFTCDCNCGGHDPDCDKATNTIKGCQFKQTCEAGVCTGQGVPWTCSTYSYDEVGKDALFPNCNCGCGAADPDCADADLDVVGCDADMTCSPTGTCLGGAKPVPAGWTCSASKSRDLLCDCNCGAYDPACDTSTTTPVGCAKGQTCGKDAKCAGEPIFPPTTWTCSEFSYATGGTTPICNCECGGYDPDCDNPKSTLNGCKKGQTCGSTGKCEGEEIKPPPEWTCPAAQYLGGGTTPICHCNCGAHDPDCDNPKSTLTGCGKGQTCGATGKCEGEIIKPPPGWSCSPDVYATGGDNAVCNCFCGGYDPDCDKPTAPIDGCGPGQTCSATGACAGQIKTPPKEWTCPVAQWGTGGDCHCNCGSPDPDCALPNKPVAGCKSGEVCSAAGLCTAK